MLNKVAKDAIKRWITENPTACKFKLCSLLNRGGKEYELCCGYVGDYVAGISCERSLCKFCHVGNTYYDIINKLLVEYVICDNDSDEETIRLVSRKFLASILKNCLEQYYLTFNRINYDVAISYICNATTSEMMEILLWIKSLNDEV